ncbi:menaquinone methyltransferase related to dlpA protein [Pochonia chlamydosporia 170]|uniref:Menaquinone methyltransferase related to dlpA protein n=1 Tax=Pochonia chlamydosporia 170 TaxID=1380566 RepID=A0A179G838_METCM|nr:menaquinone methyltransferase related to dlpA protein [Pochonia chlamydosporia 170]OAQ73967.1 menaquinone methyltransferase related to dlpA protein [Pochonia chlamydosporia 170]
MSTTSMSNSVLAKLEQYTACDISDALLKLKVPGAGFIADLNSYSGKPGNDAGTLTIAPVSTVLFAAKGETLAEPTPNVPKDTHWTDVTEPGTFVVMKQPPGQTNAICGGIMALRMKIREAKGILVAGRVRDVEELRSTNLPILAHGLSTVGSGGGSVPWALQVPLEINGVTVSPGDIAFQDPVNGVVIIPKDKVDQVLEILPKLIAADDKVKEDVLKGMSVYDAFKLHRGT